MKGIAQPSQCVPRKRESKSLGEVLTMLASADETQFQGTSTSSQSLLKQAIWKATLMSIMISEMVVMITI